jgi:hypothetical protein
MISTMQTLIYIGRVKLVPGSKNSNEFHMHAWHCLTLPALIFNVNLGSYHP